MTTIALLPIYFLSYLIPRDKKLWVFGSNLGNMFGDNPKYLYLYINQFKKEEIKPIWISSNKEVVKLLNKNGLETYYLYTWAGILNSLRAGVYIFDHISKDICFWLSGGALKINLFHGIPLKKIHYDNKFDKVRNPPNLFWKIKGSIRRLQNERPSNYFLATSKNIVPHYSSAFNSSGERGLVCGYPRNDIFFSSKNSFDMHLKYLDANAKELFNKIDSYRNAGDHIIVYMPTHRQTESKLFDVLDFKELNHYLNNNKVLMIVKAHPMSQIRNALELVEYSNIFSIPAAADPYPFLAKSDALITDYSSVYFDYLLVNRPIIFFAYDLEIYMSESRELYYRYEDVTPGDRVETMDELKESIKRSVDGVDQYRDEREKLRKMMFDYYDGKSSERLYKKIIDII